MIDYTLAIYMPMRDILSYFSAVTLQYISGHEWAIY